MRKLFFPLLLTILLFIPVGFSIDEILISESFDYLDQHLDQGWTSGGIGASADWDFTSIESIFGTYAIGINDSFISTGGGSFTHDYIYPFSTIPTSGILTITFKSFAGTSGAPGLANPIGLHFPTPSGLTGTDYITFWTGDGVQNNQDFKARCDSTASLNYGCSECHMGNLAGLGLGNYSTDTTILINLDSLTYNVSHFVNNVTYSCGAVWSDGTEDIFPEGIKVRNWYPTDRFMVAYIDDLVITWSSNLVTQSANLNEGFPCINDTQCLSGKCESGFCRLKNQAEGCTSDTQCISGQCVNSQCTKPSTWGSIDYSKTVMTGDDENNNNFIALLIMLFVGGAITVGGGTMVAGIIGGASILGLGVFFTLVGWLNPFILFGIFFLIIASGGILLLLGSKGV